MHGRNGWQHGRDWWNATDDLEQKLVGQTHITSGFLDHDFLYDSNTYCFYTGNVKGDIA